MMLVEFAPIVAAAFAVPQLTGVRAAGSPLCGASSSATGSWLSRRSGEQPATHPRPTPARQRPRYLSRPGRRIVRSRASAVRERSSRLQSRDGPQPRGFGSDPSPDRALASVKEMAAIHTRKPFSSREGLEPHEMVLVGARGFEPLRDAPPARHGPPAAVLRCGGRLVRSAALRSPASRTRPGPCGTTSQHLGLSTPAASEIVRR
jgi:hypothetical protein